MAKVSMLSLSRRKRISKLMKLSARKKGSMSRVARPRLQKRR